MVDIFLRSHCRVSFYYGYRECGLVKPAKGHVVSTLRSQNENMTTSKEIYRNRIMLLTYPKEKYEKVHQNEILAN
jgi:hypothetical protein